MGTRILLILLCLGVLWTATGCYVDPALPRVSTSFEVGIGAYQADVPYYSSYPYGYYRDDYPRYGYRRYSYYHPYGW